MQNDQLIVVEGMQPSEKLYILALIHGLGWKWAADSDFESTEEIANYVLVKFFLVHDHRLWYGTCELETTFKDNIRVTVPELEASYKKRIECNDVSQELKGYVSTLIGKSGHLGGL